MPNNPDPAAYFKRYRQQFGCSSQTEAKEFLAAKNITPGIDYAYISALLQRLEEIATRLHGIVHPAVRPASLPDFLQDELHTPYQQIERAGIIPRLNNQGRRPEEVLFSWLRGAVIANYFAPAIRAIFGVTDMAWQATGQDRLDRVETFRRAPQADFSMVSDGRVWRVELQAGFQGINDVKQHKYREARRVWQVSREGTIGIHCDLFNGQMAFIRLDQVPENDPNWITRTQMEGQLVLAIDQNHFKWRLLDPPPSLAELELDLA